MTVIKDSTNKSWIEARVGQIITKEDSDKLTQMVEIYSNDHHGLLNSLIILNAEKAEEFVHALNSCINEVKLIQNIPTDPAFTKQQIKSTVMTNILRYYNTDDMKELCIELINRI